MPPAGAAAPFATRVLSALLAIMFSGSALAQDVLRGHGGPVRALAVRAEARELISGSFDTSVIVWDLDRGAAKQVLRFHDGAVNAIASMPDGCFASAGEDRRIAVWCGAADTPAHVMEGHTGPVTSLAVLDGGRALASGSFDGTVRLWSLVPQFERKLAEHTGPVTALAASPDGRGVISAGFDGMVRHSRIGADAGPGAVRLDGPVTALVVAADGAVVAASSDGHVRIISHEWRSAPMQVVADIEVDAIPLSSLALSPDGRLIATAGLRGGVAIIERASGKITARLTGPGLPVWSLAFDGDNRTLLTGGADRVIRRWDAVAGKPLGPTVPEPETVASTERGAIVFRACGACHTLSAGDGPRAGPTLAGVLGRRIATAPGYIYSDALKTMDIVWTAETIAKLFELGPAAYTPGTKMPEQTITDPADRQALVEWLAKVGR